MNRDVVILCIGSNQIVGDSVGPMVGDYLKDCNIKAYVYGSMSRPVNAKNLCAYHDMIRSHHENALLIVVDSTVGDKTQVGEIRISRNGVKPGGAINSHLPRIGDIGVLGVVAKRSNNLVSTLMGVHISLVEKLAMKIGRLILSTIDRDSSSAI